jgi:hypothetical protein
MAQRGIEMVTTRFNVFVLALIAGGALWIEHSHRIRITASASVETSALPAATCPDNESVPFSPECMAFIQGTYQPAKLRHPIGSAGESVSSP